MTDSERVITLYTSIPPPSARNQTRLGKRLRVEYHNKTCSDGKVETALNPPYQQGSIRYNVVRGAAATRHISNYYCDHEPQLIHSSSNNNNNNNEK